MNTKHLREQEGWVGHKEMASMGNLDVQNLDVPEWQQVSGGHPGCYCLTWGGMVPDSLGDTLTTVEGPACTIFLANQSFLDPVCQPGRSLT